jgi:hypothetical protein
MPEETEVIPSQEIQEKSGLAKVSDKIAALTEDSALTVAAKTLADVLPARFYEGASTLRLSDAEKDMLAELENAPDDDLDVRPDGLVYAQHIFYRRALNRLFGPGAWALVPGSAIQQEKDGEKVHVFQRWVLVVRGCYVGESIGSAMYFASNAKQDKSDAAESAASNALTRIVAKILGIGSNPWNRRQSAAWRRKYAKQVWVKTPRGNEKWWRRIDSEPFENEIGDVPTSGGQSGAREAAARPVAGENQDDPKASRPPASAQKTEVAATVSKTAAARPGGANVTPTPAPPAPVSPEPGGGTQATEPAAKSAPPPVAPGEPMVTEGQFRWFMAHARQAKLIEADPQTKTESGGPALFFVCEALGQLPPEDLHGKTAMEALRAVILGLTLKEFNAKLVPKLREKEKEIAQ